MSAPAPRRMGLVRQLWTALRYHTVSSYVPQTHAGFVIVFLPRTGSNLLAGMLDSHPDVICHHEVFNPEAVHRSVSYKHTDLSFGTAAERDADPFAFMRRVFAFSDGQRAVGFKIAPRQSDVALLSLLLNRRIAKILLERRNHLQAYTSAVIALETRVWSVAKSAEAGGATAASATRKVRIDLAELRRFVRKRQLFHRLTRAILRATGQRFVAVDYDQLADPSAVRSILDFLGVRGDVSLSARTERQNPPRISDRIGNYAEVQEALQGTPLAAYLDPEPVEK